jgi:hypothetical protein
MNSCSQKCEQIETYDNRQFLFEKAPELLPLLNEMTNAIELTFLKVTANLADPIRFPLAGFDENSLEMLLSNRLSDLSDTKKKMAINKVESSIKNLDILKEGRYANLFEAGVFDRLESEKPIFEGATDLFTKKSNSFKKKFKFNQLLNELQHMPLPEGTNENMRPEFDKLALRLHLMKCIEETNEVGADSIGLGSVITQPNGVTSSLGPNTISNNFDKGEEINFGNLYYAFYDLWNPDGFQGFPKLCQCTLILTEIDNGGFSELIKTIFEKIKGEVAAAIGAAVGSAVGSFAGPIGAIVGAAVGFVLGALFKFFVTWWEDDLIQVVTIGAMITSFDGRWNGSTISPQLSCNFVGDGGFYRLDYSWQLLK